MYTFSPKHFCGLLKILDEGHLFVDYYDYKMARAYIKVGCEPKYRKSEYIKLKYLWKNQHQLMWERAYTIIKELSTMGKVHIRPHGFCKIKESGGFHGGNIPFIKFWPTSKWEEYFNQFDKKKLVEEVKKK